MTAITNFDEMVSKCSGGTNGNPQNVFYFKLPLLGDGTAPGTPASVTWNSWWQSQGIPCHGAVPGGTAVIPTNTTNGTLRQSDATGGRSLYLASMILSQNSSNGAICLADRLATISGLSGTVTTEQTFSSVAVSRYTGAASRGNEIWIEIYTQVGVTARTISAKYTNQDGTSGQTTPAQVFGGTSYQEAQRLIRLPLAAGDTGVQSVESVTLSASTGTAGDFGVTIMRTLAMAVTNTQRVANVTNFMGPDFAPVLIQPGAALFLYAGNVAITQANAAFNFVEV